MRTLLALTLLFGLTACTSAQDKKSAGDSAKKDSAKSKLGVGDTAPPLAVTKWLQGEPVKEFAPGKVYVLDFWATWCGPCIASMPHMNELAREFKDQGLTVVAVTTRDPNNTADAVEEFVKNTGSKYGFGFAYCNDLATEKAYMQAAEQDGIPCSFVVGKDGKIAFIGHPLELDDVLPKVVAGTWRGQADIDEIAKMNKALEGIMEGAADDPAKTLISLDGFAKTYPQKAAKDEFSLQRVVVMMLAKRPDDAKAASEPLLKKFQEKKDIAGLGSLSKIWTNRDLNPNRKYVEIGLTAADAALAAQDGGKKPLALIQAAEAYFNAGKPEKAVELGTKAVAAAEDDRQKAFFEGKLKMYKGEEQK